jgi:hypothetical protein
MPSVARALLGLAMRCGTDDFPPRTVTPMGSGKMTHQRLWARILTGALLVFAPASAAAQPDVCALTGRALNAEVEKGAAEIAKAYLGTTKQLSLNGKTSGGSSIERACNWTCGGGHVITSVANAFGFLQYNCASTTAPPSTRRPTGKDTASEMGLSITDEKYRDEADKIFRSGSTGVGALMEVPPSLERASRSGKVLDLINAVQALPGATWTLFRSTSVNNDGQGFDRIIIRVPDTKPTPRFEQWIQIAISDTTGNLGRNVDFIAVQLTEHAAPSKKLKMPSVTFRGFSRTASGFVAEGGGSGDLSKCYSCHPSGLRPVVPAARLGVSVPSGKTPTIPAADITDLTSGRGVFGPTGYTVSENGPPFGPSKRLNRAQFVAKGCAAGLPKARQQEIVDRMDCEQCHNGQNDAPSDRGILNASTNLGTLRHKLVENKLAPMPPGVTDPGGLSDVEREKLFECLRAEYAEILQEWLTADLLMVP